VTKKPHNRKHAAKGQGFPATTIGRAVPGLGLLGVPGLRDAAGRAAAVEWDAMRAALWATNYGLNLEKLRMLTLEQLAQHMNRNTAWGAVEVPSYVLATIAAMRPTEPPPERIAAVVDEVKRRDALPPPCGCQVNAPHICGR
jgi:hypothetical protein